VLLPVINIDIGNTADEQFKFSFIKDVDKISWDELVETRDESIELFFDARLDLPCREQSAAVSTFFLS